MFYMFNWVYSKDENKAHNNLQKCSWYWYLSQVQSLIGLIALEWKSSYQLKYLSKVKLQKGQYA